MPWRDCSDDPNSRPVLVERYTAIARAARAPVTDRTTRIVELCRGRRVVDVGCVDHRAATHEAATWLHRLVAGAAASCLGVDIEPEGVAAMRAAGYDAVVHDVSGGLGPVAAGAPYDVVVAGEVVEHLGTPERLFEFARDALGPGGLLVVTTPNPYAPHRVRAGQLGLAWENADHVLYAFPSGIVELGERTGFRLVEYRTVLTRPWRAELRHALVRWAERIRNRWLRGQPLGTDPESQLLPALEAYVNPLELAFVGATRSTRFLGETALYVLRREGCSP